MNTNNKNLAEFMVCLKSVNIKQLFWGLVRPERRKGKI